MMATMRLERSGLTLPSSADMRSPLSTATTATSCSPSSAFSLSLDRSDSALSTASSCSSSASSASSASSVASFSRQAISEPMRARTQSAHSTHQPLTDVTNIAHGLESLQLPPAASSLHATSCPANTASTVKVQHPALPPPFSLIRHAAEATLAYEHYCTLFDRQGSLRAVYDPTASYLRHRVPLLAWLLECCESELGLSTLTVSSAVALLDYYCTTVPTLPAQSLQLIALCSTLLAAKYCENETEAPSLSQLVQCAGDVYTAEQLRQAELWCLQRANWSVGVITATHFVQHLCQPYTLQHIISSQHDAAQHSSRHAHLTTQLARCIHYLDRLCLRSPLLSALPPSLLAGALVCAARHCIGLDGWHDGLRLVLDSDRDETLMWAGQVLDWHNGGQDKVSCHAQHHQSEHSSQGMEM